MSNITHCSNAVDLGNTLGAHIGSLITKKLDDDPQVKFYLGCPGGRSPMTTYAALANELAERKVDLSRVVIVMMDDYVVKDGDTWQHVDADAHYSCRRFAREDIGKVLNEAAEEGNFLPEENIWFPNPSDPQSYDRKLESVGGIDFFILASGSSDGHVAFNPPGTKEDSETRVVDLAEVTRIDNLGTFPEFKSLSDVPRHGISVGVGTIKRLSKDAALVLTGSNKSRAYQELSAAKAYNENWPATVVHTIPGALIMVDDEAI